MSVYLTTARNFSVNTENRIHSDEVAARFGFAGALVPGAAVFGHMAYPLVDTLGPDWLAGSHASVRFLKPAYDGEGLTVTHDAIGDAHTVRCHARGILLAELHTRPLDPDDGPATAEPGTPFRQRPEIEWDNVNSRRAVSGVDMVTRRGRKRRVRRAGGGRPGLLPDRRSCIRTPS